MSRVPSYELLLARLIQETKARGLRATAGAYYRNRRGKPCTEAEAVACCVNGAACLGSKRPHTNVGWYALASGSASGNDGCPLAFGPGYALGQAYYDACKEKA